MCMVVSTYGLNKSECLCVTREAFSRMGLWIASHGIITAELMPLLDAGCAIVTCRFIKFVLKLFDELIVTRKECSLANYRPRSYCASRLDCASRLEIYFALGDLGFSE
jgi:hypothetical protein